MLRIFVISLLVVLVGCSESKDASKEAESANELVLYCGRSQSLAEPVIESFQAKTGTKVQVKYGGSAQLALTLDEEGDRSHADVFWSQDAGALGVLSKRGRLAPVPEALTTNVPAKFRSTNWIATSGRARVLAYASDKVENFPQSVEDLADPEWSGRVGWAPANGSFQAFVTALRVSWGEERTEAWLRAVKANGAKAYPKNTAIIQALAAGEVDLGLPNHYYLLRLKNVYLSSNPDEQTYPVAQTHFAAGDMGNLVNVAGVGIRAGAANQKNAEAFVAHLLSQESQQYFTEDVLEYPVTGAVNPDPALVSTEELTRLAPAFDLEDLDDLEGTLALLRKVELL